MSSNKLKKMILFSNERLKSIAEGMVFDESINENRTASSLIENHLLNDLLPKNKSACIWVMYLYEGNWDIGRVLEASFCHLSEGLDWKAMCDNGLPLVKYAKHWGGFLNRNPDPEAREMRHFLSQFDSVVTKLEKFSDKSFELKNEAEYVRDIYEIGKNEPGYLNFSTIYNIIINNWDFLKDWTITYRLLADVVRMQKNWITDEYSRYELTNILKEISNDWKY